MKFLLSALLVMGVFIAVTAINSTYGETQDPTLYNYMIVHFEEDTAAHNAIAAILLNYRMYDTMFEALILLTAIVGMKQFLPAAHELKSAENGEKHRV
jgi:multisubunit Na+/H+ antiporter MnhB subunit